MPKNRYTAARVKLSGRSWCASNQGVYCFDAIVDGEPAELRVAEDVAFDLLGAWTRSEEKCLDILRLHRAELAKSLERILHGVGGRDHNGHYLLTLADIERKSALARDESRTKRPDPAPEGSGDDKY
jgi:hypothetical protein